MGQPTRVAVLVDADNVSGEHITFAVTRAARHGEIVVKRAFGRVTSMTGKAEILTRHGFTAEVTFPPQGNGKNAADLMLAQYATRLAERRVVEIVALVSSDGDFAPIAAGLAEAGIRTLGFGRQDTPAALQGSCAQFIPFPAAPPAVRPAAPKAVVAQTDAVRLSSILDQLTASGDVHFSALGDTMRDTFGAGYARRFGAKNLTELVEGLDGYEVKAQGTARWIVRRASAQLVSLPARPAASG